MFQMLLSTNDRITRQLVKDFSLMMSFELLLIPTLETHTYTFLVLLLLMEENKCRSGNSAHVD